MKCRLLSALGIMLLSVTAAMAEGPDPAIYGTKLIPDTFDLEQYKPDGDQPESSYFIYDSPWRQYSVIQMALSGGDGAVWSNDGKLAALGSHVGIAVYSPELDTVQFAYDSSYNYDGWAIDMQLVDLCCFSPDGKELFFDCWIVEDESKISLTIENGKFISSSSNGGFSIALMAVNIETGESRMVRKEAKNARFSPDGNYFAYYYDDGITVTDTGSGSTHRLPIDTYRFNFSLDSKDIVYVKDRTLWKMPVEGGEPVTIPINVGGSGRFWMFTLHPGGEWVVYPGDGGPRSGTKYDPVTGEKTGSYSTSSITKLFASNIVTGESLALFPVPGDIEMKWGTFTPDGSKICYYHNNYLDNEGNGIYMIDFDTSIAMKYSAAVSVDEIAPEGFALNAPYPNPFNPSTTIGFTLPSAGFAELSIFNTAGQRIRQLVSGDLTPGAHSVIWDGKTDSGSAVSSGVYISRLKAGENSSNQRMTFVK